MNNIVTGKVKWFNDHKGFGFLSTESIVGDIFVHYSAILGELKTLNENDVVEFDLVTGPKGPQGFNVKRLEIAPRNELINE